MKSAIVAAITAAIVASGAAAATTWINGHSIRPHSIPLNRLVHKPPAGKRGPRGATGAKGDTGAIGPAGPQGGAGRDGTSVTSVTLGSGDAHCPDGGSAFTSANATTYACNGTRISSISDLDGVACSNGGQDGVISVAFGAGETVTLTCRIAGQTTLAAAASGGDNNVKVASVAGMSTGEHMTIDTGTGAETVTINAIGTPGPVGTGVAFTPALAAAHPSGATVTFGP